MPRVVIEDQVRDFCLCLTPPITENELFECFSNQPEVDKHSDKTQPFTAKTAAGRTLQISFRYCTWTDEFVVLKAADAPHKQSHNVTTQVPPDELLQIAERYVGLALKLIPAIKKSAPKSRDHHRAEAAFTEFIGQANSLFCTAHSRFSDQSMKDHVLVKMEYLNDIEKQGRCHFASANRDRRYF